MDKLMDIIGNKSQIIRRNYSNELKVDGHAVPASTFDQLYAAVLSLRKLQHMAGITELLSALRQLNVESNNIVSNLINTTYKRGV